MFERRRRPTEPLPMMQTRRHLRSGESIPPCPGLLDQIAAIRADVERSQNAVIDEVELERDEMFVDVDDDLDE